ncbi:flagellar biosynthesis protein FlhF [Desulfonauticus submarinus]|uniref:Flagellar biosynthesis protein FlhF n=1 Tax=Desulfonauticus submarinus TaxID=206665 RepID=A0A1H0B626_9BACT|nr:hypothetical protein [Desulfonauticus submarinus]SDN41071.1 flagellar biosynthesis protein FlhF [Desulfonauticus submarinus]
MQIRTFEGKSLSSLMAQIKKEMGPEAVILNTETIGKNGSTTYKVSVAIESSENYPSSKKNNLSLPEAKLTVPQEEWFKTIMLEWENFKESIFTLLEPQSKLKLPAKYAQAIRYLEKQGVKKEILIKIISSLTNIKDNSLLGVLKEKIKVKPWPKNFLNKKIHFFLGPPGCGQTSNLLKMLLKLKQLNPSNILLAYPLNGNLEGKLILEHYANLIDIDFKKISPENLDTLQNAPYDYIFIDLPHQLQEFKKFLSLKKNNSCLHVSLSPVYEENYLKLFLNKVGINKISSLIWTRLDEATKLGSIINFCVDYNLPISFLSYGSQLKNSSFMGNKDKILRYIFKREIN